MSSHKKRHPILEAVTFPAFLIKMFTKNAWVWMLLATALVAVAAVILGEPLRLSFAGAVLVWVVVPTSIWYGLILEAMIDQALQAKQRENGVLPHAVEYDSFGEREIAEVA